MPDFYEVAVRAPKFFDQDDPVIFKPIAHTSDQAIGLVMRYIYGAVPNDILVEDMQVHVKMAGKIGGYDSPDIELSMRTRAP